MLALELLGGHRPVPARLRIASIDVSGGHDQRPVGSLLDQHLFAGLLP